MIFLPPNKIIMICEGKNDRIFLHKTITRKLAIDSSHVETFPNIQSLQRELRKSKQKRILIAEGNGYPNYIRVVIPFIRPFWYKNTLHAVGVIGDSDRGPVYRKLKNELCEYLGQSCTIHNVTPQVDQCDSRQRLTLSFRRRSDIIMWTLEVPDSLETQIAKVLKNQYHQLRSINDSHEVIKVASHQLRISTEEVIRQSVEWFENENWFNRFCINLKRNLSLTLNYISNSCWHHPPF